MAIRFKPKPPEQQDAPPPPPPRVIYLPAVPAAEAEARLFAFLQGLLAGEARAEAPLLLAPAVYDRLRRRPEPQLIKALRHLLDDLLLALDPDPGRFGALVIDPACIGVAIAAHNALLPSLARSDPGGDLLDPTDAFNSALLRTLPPARALPDLLAYHALLRAPAERLGSGAPGRPDLLAALLERSPLTAACRPDLHLPAALLPLARELLPGWRRVPDPPPPSWTLDAWLDSLMPLLADPGLARLLRHRWLALPAERPAARNLGLLLEALRRRAVAADRPSPSGSEPAAHRRRPLLADQILQFYEAYDRTHGRPPVGAAGPSGPRDWPLFATIEPLLRTPGDNDAALRLCRRGAEGLLLFWPFAQIAMDEGGPPLDYRHLSRALLTRVGELLPLTTLLDPEAGERALETIEFDGEDGA